MKKNIVTESLNKADSSDLSPLDISGTDVGPVDVAKSVGAALALLAEDADEECRDREDRYEIAYGAHLVTKIQIDYRFSKSIINLYFCHQMSSISKMVPTDSLALSRSKILKTTTDSDSSARLTV